MPIELCFLPTENAQRLSLNELGEQLCLVGLSCKTYTDSLQQSWIDFDDFSSNVCVSIEDNYAIFAILHWVSSEDDIDVTLKIDSAFEKLGWVCGG